MADANQLKHVYSELRDEHAELMALIDRLSTQKRVVDLLPDLEVLHNLLIKHFAHEQFPGGLYESMGINGAAYHDDLKVLVEDHCVILSAVSVLLERARVSTGQTRADIFTQRDKVIAAIREHEKREHALADAVLRKANAGQHAPASIS